MKPDEFYKLIKNLNETMLTLSKRIKKIKYNK